MTFGGFLLGLIIMGFGFLMVRYTEWFRNNLGDLGAAFGAYGASWMSWKLAGVIAMTVGFLIAFGLIQLFLAVTVGRLLNFGV